MSDSKRSKLTAAEVLSELTGRSADEFTVDVDEHPMPHPDDLETVERDE